MILMWKLRSWMLVWLSGRMMDHSTMLNTYRSRFIYRESHWQNSLHWRHVYYILNTKPLQEQRHSSLLVIHTIRLHNLMTNPAPNSHLPYMCIWLELRLTWWFLIWILTIFQAVILIYEGNIITKKKHWVFLKSKRKFTT